MPLIGKWAVMCPSGDIRDNREAGCADVGPYPPTSGATLGKAVPYLLVEGGCEVTLCETTLMQCGGILTMTLCTAGHFAPSTLTGTKQEQELRWPACSMSLAPGSSPVMLLDQIRVLLMVSRLESPSLPWVPQEEKEMKDGVVGSCCSY